jgi:hypothetical protein
MFSYLLKGKKEKYKNFFQNSFKNSQSENILIIKIDRFDFKNKIKYFFDKDSLLYDKTKIDYTLDLNINPERKEFRVFDFAKKIDILHSISMLSSRVTNNNLLFNFNLINKKFSDENINNFLKYLLTTYFSRKIDYVFISRDSMEDKKILKVFDTLNLNLEESKFINFSNSKDLYVITCEKNNKKFDIIWLSTNREIELTDFKKVYDKFGNLLTKDIKITQSPIYAFHE